MMLPSGSAITSSATCACSAWLYSTTGGQTPGGPSEPAPAQAVKKSVAAPRAARGGVQHVALNGKDALLTFEPFGDAACALGRAAKVEDQKKNGEGDEGETHRPPRPWSAEDSGQ